MRQAARARLSIDPGPMARFREVIADPTTMSVIVQRLTDSDTLKDIAKSWEIPYGKLAEWVTEDRERSEQYSRALAIWSDSLAQETVRIADDVMADRDEVAKAKLQTSVRMGLARALNRGRYGEAVEHKVSGAVSLIAVLSGLPRTGEIDVTPPAAALPEPTPEKIPEKSAKSEALI